MREVRIMRKILFAAFIGLVSIGLVSGVAYAITGKCSNCHTMHNSQAGEPMRWDEGEAGLEQLLLGDCIGCHSGDSPIKTIDEADVPVVLQMGNPEFTGPTYSLAGGDFYWVANGDDAKGHNVAPIVADQDSNIGLNPPGWDPTATTGFAFGQVAGGAESWAEQLTCDGVYGCHGKHDATGVSGAHHANASGSLTTANTVGNSYRFLGNIHGYEDDDWEDTALDNSPNHNQYKGVEENANYTNRTTISFSCAECHGYFHSDIGGTSSLWSRHPTDIMLPGGETEYAGYNGTGNPYSIVAPVGSVDVSTQLSNVTPGTNDALALCISCHRAHGSEYNDLLRWNYDDMIAGSTNTGGCFICHTTKRSTE